MAESDFTPIGVVEEDEEVFTPVGEVVEEEFTPVSVAAEPREIVSRYLGTGTTAQSIAGREIGVYDNLKGGLNQLTDSSDAVASALKESEGDIDKAIQIVNRDTEASQAMRDSITDAANPFAFVGAIDTIKNTPAADKLSALKSELDAAGIPAEDRPRIIQDAAKATAWTEQDDDRLRKLSDGELVINPGRVFGDKDALRSEIQSSDTDDANKQAALQRLDTMREAMAGKIFTSTAYTDDGFKTFADARMEDGAEDKAQILDEWSRQQKDRNWVFKQADAIGEGIKSASVGIDKTLVGTAAGLAAVAGLEDAAGTLGGIEAQMGEVLQDEAEAAKLRGLTGQYQVTSDIVNTVGQMAPMLVGGQVAQGLRGIAQPILANMSVYGWAAAQGYESKLADALDMAREKKGSDLTEDEITATLGDTQTQVAGFLNGFQTAILSKVLGGGAERAALGRAAESLTVRDFLRRGGITALRDGTLRQELRSMGKTILADATDESVEEFTNQVLDGAISAAVLDKEVLLGDLLEESFKAGALGGLVGGGLPQLRRSGREVPTTTSEAPTTPEIRESEELIAEALPLAPQSAIAAAETNPETDESNPQMELPVPGVRTLEPDAEAPGATLGPVTDGTDAPTEGALPLGDAAPETEIGEVSPGEVVPATNPAESGSLNETAPDLEQPGDTVVEPTTAVEPGPTAPVDEAIQRVTTRYPSLPSVFKFDDTRSNRLSAGARARTDGTISINRADLERELAKYPPERRAERLDAILDEEIVHLAQFEAAKRSGENTQDFYSSLWSEFTPEQQAAARTVYPTGFKGMNDWQKAAEAVRVFVQQRSQGEVTELTRAFSANISQKMVDLLRNTLEYLRNVVASGQVSPRIQSTIESVESVLAEFSGSQNAENDPQTDLVSTGDPQAPTFGGNFATEERERAAKNLPPSPVVPPWTEQEVWDAALATEAANTLPTTAGAALFKRLKAEGRFTLTPQEHALMVHEIMVREQTISRQYTDLANLTNNTIPGVRKSAQAAVRDSQGEYDDIWTYMHAVGSAAGSALRARQLQVNLDFSLASMMRSARAKLNLNSKTPLDLTEEQIKEITSLHQKIREGEARELALRSDNTELIEKVEALARDVEAAQKKASARDLRSKSKIRKILNPRVDEAKQRLLDRGRIALANALDPKEGKVYTGDTLFSGATDSGLSPELLEDLRDVSIMAAGWLVEKTYDLAEFTNRVGRDFGSWALEHVERIRSDAQQIYHETYESVQGRAAPRAEDIVAGLGGEQPLDRKTVGALARAFVIAGRRGNNVLDATYEALLPTFPDLTREEVATLFTDYGRVTYPSQDEVPKELSRIRNLERTALKLAGLRAGKVPLRTGYQRGEQDAEIRELEKQFRKELKESGLEVEDPEAQLQSALGAAKRRMQNEIEEIQRAIDRGTPRTANNSTLSYDEEALALKSELETKRAEYATAFDTSITPEQRIAQAIKALDRQIAEEDRMLADGVLKRPPGEPLPSSPDIEARRQTLAEKRQNRRDLYEAANPGETALKQAKEAAIRSIENLQALVVSNAAAVRERNTVNPDAELQALWDARETLQDEVNEIRRSLPLTPAKLARQVQQALESSQRTLANLEDRIARKDLTKTPAKQTAASQDAAVRASRERVAELNRTLAQMRRDSGLFAPTEEQRIERRIAAIRKRNEELRRRLREKDISRKPKPPSVTSKELREIQYENDKLKAEFSELQGRMVLKGSVGARIKYAVGGASNLFKVLPLGGDAGVILRQLGTTFSAIAKDTNVQVRRSGIFGGDVRAVAQAEHERQGVRLAKLLTTGLQSFRNETIENEVYRTVRTRSGAEFDNIGGKVHFMAPFDTFDSQKEDVPRADLIKTIPWWVWPALGVGSVVAFGATPGVAAATIAYAAIRKPLMLRLDRAQRTMTNVSRAMWVDEMRFHASLAGARTLNNDDHALLNNAVMVGTGRGKVRAWEGAIPTLNYLANAPRFYLSRLQALTLQPLVKGALGGDGHTAAAQTRAEIAKMYGLSIQGRAMVLALGTLLMGFKGDDEDDEERGFVWDPRSPDFGRLRINEDVKFDTMSGFNSFISIIARTATKERVEKDGSITVLGSGFSNSVGNEMENFLATKRNMMLSFITNLHSGSFYGGEAVTTESVLKNATTAIIANDMEKIYKELGFVRGAAMMTLLFSGAGTVVKPGEDEAEKLKSDRRANQQKDREEQLRLNEGRDENSGMIKF